MSYKPYMIDPGTNQDGEDYTAYCRRRWGGDGWTHSLRDRGRQMGLRFGNWAWWPNTLNAHRLCVYLDELDSGRADLSAAEKEKRALDLMKKYYELTYERGLNISTPEGAALALEELGLAKSKDAVVWLEQGGGKREVAQADRFAKNDMDVHGVPLFEISDAAGARPPVQLSGAQPASAFANAFRRVAG